MKAREFSRRARQMATSYRKKKKRQRCLEVHLSQELSTAITSREQLESTIVETAYDYYARGTGNALGRCTTHWDSNSSTYRLIYNWTGGVTATRNFQPLLSYQSTGGDLITTGPLTVSNWLPEDNLWAEAARGLVNGLQGIEDALRPALPPERLAIVNKKAAALLLQHLSEPQRKTWLAERYFDLQAPSGRKYRLFPKIFHNVFLLDSFGNKVREYCAFPRDPGGELPIEDHLFAQMLTLQFNETEFLRMANTWDLLGGKRVFVGQGVDAEAHIEGIAA